MNKNVIVLIVIFLCISVGVGFSFNICRAGHDNNNKLSQKIISSKYWLEFESDNQAIINCRMKGNEYNSDSLFLNEIIGESPMVVLRFKETNCNVCIEYALDNLIQHTSKLDTNNIIIIGSFGNTRARWMRKSPFKIFNIGNQELGLSLEKENMPYYFILDKDFNAKSVFIPFKELPSFTDRYFEFLERKIL